MGGIWSFGDLVLGAQVIGMLGLAAYTYLGDKDKASGVALKELKTEMSHDLEQHDNRIRNVEAHLGNQPTHRDIAALYESINTLANTVNQLVGETKVQSDMLRMLINREVNKGHS